MSDTAKIVKEIYLPEASIILREDGIVHVHYNKDIILDVPLQLKMLEKFNEITEGKLSPFLFTASDGINVTPEARDNAVKIEDISPLNGTAVVVSNIGYLLIANFYLKFNKPKRPYKVFKHEADAIRWLKAFVK